MKLGAWNFRQFSPQVDSSITQYVPIHSIGNSNPFSEAQLTLAMYIAPLIDSSFASFQHLYFVSMQNWSRKENMCPLYFL